jgi:hypothetical protein
MGVLAEGLFEAASRFEEAGVVELGDRAGKYGQLVQGYGLFVAALGGE